MSTATPNTGTDVALRKGFHKLTAYDMAASAASCLTPARRANSPNCSPAKPTSTSRPTATAWNC